MTITSDRTDIDLIPPEAWLAALRDPTVAVEQGAVFLNPVAGSWTTAPRIEPSYGVHYLFGSPRAALEVRLGQWRFELPGGSMAWFPPGLPYELAMRSRRTREQLVRLRFCLRHRGRNLSPFDGMRVVPEVARVRDLAERLRGEWLAPRPYADDAVRCLLGQLSVLALRVERWSERPRGKLSPQQLGDLAAHVAERIDARPTPSELAGVLGLSPTHFARVFKATVGCTPRAWLVRERIRHAATRLRESDRPIAEIAAEFGYDNPFLFSRQFAEVMGCSPRVWRRV